MLTIREKNIGEGAPLICVPIIDTTKDSILSHASSLFDKQVDMIEWRMDWFEGIEESESVVAVLQEMYKLREKSQSQTLILATYRSKKQGGEGQLSVEDLEALLIKVATSGAADLLDVEYHEWKEPKILIQKLKEKGAVIVASEHHFTKTPAVEDMVDCLNEMRIGGADIAKLAVMPQCKMDVVHLIEATVRMTEAYPDTPVITMSMGATGMVSRLSGQVFGSCVTFGADGACSAPGQVPYEKLKQVLEIIEESM